MTKAGERYGMAKHTRRTAASAPKALRAPLDDRAHPGPVEDRRHDEAIGVYADAMRHLQARDFGRAAERLRHLITAYPDQREVSERARLYLSLCDSQLHPVPGEPSSTAERIYAATLALNAGRVADAIRHLDQVRREDPANDRALYMLAAAHARRGDAEVAIPYLQRAIESNPDNRVLARVDPDLVGLRAKDTIAALLESPSRPHIAPPRSAPARRAR
jgi:predicted Zn-dependent protease